MQCGTKKFIVEYERDNERVSKEVAAQSPIKARKTVRKAIGQAGRIFSCRVQNNSIKH